MRDSDTDAIVRTARIDDAAAVAQLCGELGYPTTTDAARARLDGLLASADHHVLVAEVAGDVVGFASLLRARTLHSDDLSVRLSSLVVASLARGRGIGAMLVAASEQWAREQGAGSLHLTSGSHRPDAHRFYEALAYTADGLRFRRQLP